MATLTINETAPSPSEQIVADANRIVKTTDARGRTLGVRKLNMAIRRRILKALSDEMSRKQQYLGLVMVAACVVEIDGDAISLPSTELQFDALIDRLDDDGFEAVGAALVEHFGASASPEGVVGEAKE